MGDEERGREKTVTAEVTTAEYSALVKAAKRHELPLPELVRAFVVYCLERLEAGDAGLQRAVKGSRDAAIR